MLFGPAPALHVSRTSPPACLERRREEQRGQPPGAAIRHGDGADGTRAHHDPARRRRPHDPKLHDAGVRRPRLCAGWPHDHACAVARFEIRHAGRRRAFFDQLEPRLRAIPGVEAAAITNGVPPHDGGERLLEIDVPRDSAGAAPVFVGTVTITPEFFAAAGAPDSRTEFQLTRMVPRALKRSS